jgi:hypothetical protein
MANHKHLRLNRRGRSRTSGTGAPGFARRSVPPFVAGARENRTLGLSGLAAPSDGDLGAAPMGRARKFRHAFVLRLRRRHGETRTRWEDVDRRIDQHTDFLMESEEVPVTIGVNRVVYPTPHRNGLALERWFTRRHGVNRQRTAHNFSPVCRGESSTRSPRPRGGYPSPFHTPAPWTLRLLRRIGMTLRSPGTSFTPSLSTHGWSTVATLVPFPRLALRARLAGDDRRDMNRRCTRRPCYSAMFSRETAMATKHKVKTSKAEAKAPRSRTASGTPRLSAAALHHEAHLESERLSRLRKRPTRF